MSMMNINLELKGTCNQPVHKSIFIVVDYYTDRDRHVAAGARTDKHFWGAVAPPLLPSPSFPSLSSPSPPSLPYPPHFFFPSPPLPSGVRGYNPRKIFSILRWSQVSFSAFLTQNTAA
jgi:hypothetical protein